MVPQRVGEESEKGFVHKQRDTTRLTLTPSLLRLWRSRWFQPWYDPVWTSVVPLPRSGSGYHWWRTDGEYIGIVPGKSVVHNVGRFRTKKWSPITQGKIGSHPNLYSRFWIPDLNLQSPETKYENKKIITIKIWHRLSHRFSVLFQEKWEGKGKTFTFLREDLDTQHEGPQPLLDYVRKGTGEVENRVTRHP